VLEFNLETLLAHDMPTHLDQLL